MEKGRCDVRGVRFRKLKKRKWDHDVLSYLYYTELPRQYKESCPEGAYA